MPLLKFSSTPVGVDSWACFESATGNIFMTECVLPSRRKDAVTPAWNEGVSVV